jgi:plastocyanin
MKPDSITLVLTRVGLAGLLLALFVPTTPQIMGEPNALRGNSVYEVTVHVRLVPACPARPLEDSNQVVVWLVRTKPGQVARLHTETPHYRIIQHHKLFEPRLLVVPAGSIVEFRDRDPWLHKVFSVSRSRPFDLGRYEAGAQKAVTFDRSGVSYLFCKIHPEMMAIVLTVDSAYFGVSDKTGYISIGNVPHGKYVLHVWYENAAPQVLERLQRIISVGDDNRSQPTISIGLANEIPMTGKNYNSEQPTFVGANWGRR